MALYSAVAGNRAVVLDVDQYYNLLTGVMTDQAVTLSFPQTASFASAMALVLKRTTASTQVQGLTFKTGVVSDAVIYRQAGDDGLFFGYDVGSGIAVGQRPVRIGMGSGSGGSALGYHSLTVDPDGQNTGTADWWLQFGSNASTEGIGSKRSAGVNQNGLDFLTSSTIRMAIDSGGATYIGGVRGAATLAIRPDSTGINPDSNTGAWMRGDGGGGLILNPSTSSGHLYFAWDTASQSFFGTAGINSFGNVLSNQFICIEGKDTTTRYHQEVGYLSDTVVSGTSNTTVSYTFGRAFGSTPHVSISGLTPSGSKNTFTAYVSAISTTAVSFILYNNDASSLTISNLRVFACGT